MASARERWNWIAALLADESRTGCRDWPFHTFGKGYARFDQAGTRASHIVLTKSGHPRPESPNDLALHSCDRPICVAPWHLSWGSQKENLAQAYERGRREHPTKLTSGQISHIQRLYSYGEFGQLDLALRFGVAQSIISKWVRRDRVVQP